MNLDSVRAALAAIPDRDLRAFIGAAQACTGCVGGLLAWLEHAAGWEVDRRADRHYPMREPMEAMDAAEVPDSLFALAALTMQFRHDRGHEAVAVFLGATADCLVQGSPTPSGSIH